MLLTQEYKEDWSLSSKLVFRFLCTYFILYILFTFTSSLFETPFRWIGHTILKIDYSYDVSGYGSGDNTYAYITLFANAIFAVILSIVWSIFDRRRKNYNQLFYWFIVLLRIYLTLFMLTYGFFKIYQTQFPSPSLNSLLQPLGEFSPMGLAWTYMGYSEGFNFFTGMMEVIGGLLLIPRRTQTIGAFITAGVMTHVAVMNFMFDIPVKLFSVHLVLMALVIFSTDLNRFLNVFFKNKSVAACQYYHPINDKTYAHIIKILKLVALSLLVLLFSFQGCQREKMWGHKREKPYLYGIWEASYFLKNKDTLPPLVTDEERWRYLIIDYKDKATIKTMNGKKHRFRFIPDSTTNQLQIYRSGVKNDTFNFNYSKPNADYLEIEGIHELDTLKIIFLRKNLDDFLLHSRGFNWINEKPFNR